MENHNSKYYQYRKEMPPYKKNYYYNKMAFTPSYRPSRPPVVVSDKEISEFMKGVNKKNMLDKSKDILNNISKYAKTPAGAIVLGQLYNHANTFYHSHKDKLPYALYNRKASGTFEDSKIYIIDMHIGYKSSKSIMQAGSINGSSILELNNSMSNVRTKTQGRESLRKGVGFNEKGFDFLGSQFTHNIAQYDKIYNISNFDFEKNSRTVPYGLVKEQFTNIKIRNSNTYHAAKFKIHLVKIIDDDVNMWLLYDKTFNVNNKDKQISAIPLVYQKGKKDTTSNKFMHSVICYKGASVNLSPAFKANAVIVKTISETLGPGDLLDLRLTCHFGSGLRFDMAKQYLTTAAKGSQPATYGYIVEVEGTMCEGIQHLNNLRFQGTCPVWYNYEFRSCVKLVKNLNLVSSNNLQDLDETKKSYAIKVYDREYLEDRPYSVAISQIGAPGEKGKSFSVVSTSVEEIVYSKDSSTIPIPAPGENQEDFKELETENFIEEDE